MKPTMQQLREMSEKDFIAAVLHEKLDKMQNPNTPLAAKVRAAINYIANQPNQTKRGGTWALTITDTDGSSITPINLPDAELDRIAELVRQGYSGGECSTAEVF